MGSARATRRRPARRRRRVGGWKWQSLQTSFETYRETEQSADRMIERERELDLSISLIRRVYFLLSSLQSSTSGFLVKIIFRVMIICEACASLSVYYLFFHFHLNAWGRKGNWLSSSSFFWPSKKKKETVYRISLSLFPCARALHIERFFLPLLSFKTSNLSYNMPRWVGTYVWRDFSRPEKNVFFLSRNIEAIKVVAKL